MPDKYATATGRYNENVLSQIMLHYISFEWTNLHSVMLYKS